MKQQWTITMMVGYVIDIKIYIQRFWRSRLESQTSDKRINVLVLITAMDRAGAETMMMNYLRHIDRNKIHMDFVLNREYESEYEKEIKEFREKIMNK